LLLKIFILALTGVEIFGRSLFFHAVNVARSAVLLNECLARGVLNSEIVGSAADRNVVLKD
jgi:hypothetical protein